LTKLNHFLSNWTHLVTLIGITEATVICTQSIYVVVVVLAAVVRAVVGPQVVQGDGDEVLEKNY
jgi:hypothetical protein